jgi:hypothetical protein
MDIAKHITQLRDAGAAGLDQYEKRLRNNEPHPERVKDLFYEGLAALMFLRHGFLVTLRERPDLLIELDGDAVYAEVKRFCWKILDGLNQVAMFGATAGVLVRLEGPTETEGKSAWEQIADVAVRKAPQYVDGTANIVPSPLPYAPILMQLSSSRNIPLLQPGYGSAPLQHADPFRPAPGCGDQSCA